MDNNDDQINPFDLKTAQTGNPPEIQEALRELENIYRAAHVGLCVLDKELRYVRINDRLAEINGIPAADHIGRTVRDVLPSFFADHIEGLAKRVFVSGKPQLKVEVSGMMPSQAGEERFWIQHWLPITNDTGAVIGINIVVHEITEQRRMEEELKRSHSEMELRVQERTAELEKANERLEEENRERIRSERTLRLEERRLEALFRLSQISEAPLEEIANLTLEQCIELTDSKIGFLGSLDEDETVYILHAVSKDIVKECSVTGDPLQWHIPDAGIWADAIRKRKSLFVNDYSKSHSSKKGLPAGHPSVERLMVVPIIDDGKIRIVAGVGNKTSDYDNSDERQLVLLLSSMWNYTQKRRSQEALQKAYEKLEEKVVQRTAQLEAAARELEASQNDLNRAQEVGQIGSWRLDFRDNSLAWSDESHRIFGIPKGTPQTYQTFLEIVHPNDRQYVDRKWKAAMGGEPYDIEHRIIVGDQVKWLRERAYLEFDDRGDLSGAFGISQDITGRKQIEEALKQSEENYRELVQHANSAIIRWRRDGSITFFNEYAQSFFGYRADEIIGQDVRVLLPESSLIGSDLQKLTDDILDYPERYAQNVNENICRDGRRVWMAWTNKPVFDGNGQVAEILAVGMDITERKLIEDELKRSHHELELRVQQRTKELSAALRSLHEYAHKLRQTTAELIIAEQHERQKLAQILHDGLQQMLVAAIFHLELIRDGQYKPEDVTQSIQILDEAIETSRSLAAELSPPILLRKDLCATLRWLSTWMRDTHGLNVDLKYPHNMQPLGEEILLVLFQSIRELLFNVVKHSEVREASLELNQQDGQILILIEDKGTGFNVDRLHLKKAETEGFGLFSIRERLSLMGGKMEIDSAVGRGTQIRLTAPLSSGTTVTDRMSIIEQMPVQKVIPTEEVQQAEKEMKIRIMLVDDHEVVRNGVADLILREPDFQIVGEASDGESAVSLVREIRPNVILMDINMPRMNGIEATRIIHNEFADIRIIGFSVSDEKLQRKAIIDAGAVGYFAKSGSSKDLIATIRSYSQEIPS